MSLRQSPPALISIAAPVYNEEELLPLFYQRIANVLRDYAFEIVFVDDGSRDRSWSVIEQIAQKDPRVKGVRFSRNFGHQPALTAGLEHASGEVVVLIDSDLQDPPELILDMIQKWQEGFDVVYAIRSERKGETWFKKITATYFYRFLRHSSRLDIPLETGDFRLMSREVVQALSRLPERVRFLRGLSSWVGFKQTGIPYTRDKREAGSTKFPLFKMLKFAFDGISSFSLMPLQFATYLGMAATFLSFVILVYSLVIRFFVASVVPGWASLMTAIVFMGGVQLMMIGIIGEYVGRIYEEVKHRPMYIVGERIGLSETVSQ